jgi:uncharacterized protein (TIGR01777 family)
MRILVTGSTGFVGSAIVKKLESDGHSIVRVVRPGGPASNGPGARQEIVRWDPLSQIFDAAPAENADALIHLAGASIADGRWNAARKTLLQTSRIESTQHLMHSLSQLKAPPRVIVAASAIGIYGDRGDETLVETSEPGHDFLAELCRAWELESAQGTGFGARVVTLRFGIILGSHGGALPRMAMPMKIGVGGKLGTGRQWMSWVTLTEIVNVTQFALANAGLSGAVNAVAPNPARNSDFTRVLAKTLHRPAIFPAPAFALRLALGEMADALLLSSQRVLPVRLEQAGYQFTHPDLQEALQSVLEN